MDLDRTLKNEIFVCLLPVEITSHDTSFLSRGLSFKVSSQTTLLYLVALFSVATEVADFQLCCMFRVWKVL